MPRALFWVQVSETIAFRGFAPEAASDESEAAQRIEKSMKMHDRLRAGALGAALVLLGAPVCAATGDLPNLGHGVTVSRLPAGGIAIVRPAEGAPVAAIELWYRAPSIGFGTKAQPALARVAAQVVAASKPIVGDALGKTVADVGGRLAISVYTDSIEISAIVPTQSARAIVKTMTTAFFAPVVTQDGFGFAQHDVRQEALFSTLDLETVARDAVFAQLFSDGPQHYPAVGDQKDVSQITLAQVQSFATRAFRSQNATLVLSGAVDPTIVTAAVAGRSGTADAMPEAPTPGILAAAPATTAEPFVQASAGYGWIGPAIADEREATAMDFIADYLFRSIPADAGVVSKRVGERYPDAVVIGQFITLHDPGVMFVCYGGKDLAGVKGLVDDGLAAARQPLPGPVFAAAIRAFEYHLLSDLQTPVQLADNFGWYFVEGNPAYAPSANGEHGAYFTAAQSLTPAFVAAVARKYLGKTPAVVNFSPETKKAVQ